MSDLPPPGWHHDPSDPAMLRWWDGRQWTEHRHPVTPPAAGAPAPNYGAPGPSWGGPPGQPPYGTQPPTGNQPPYGSQPPYGGQPGWGMPAGWGGGGQGPYPARGRRGLRGPGAGLGPNSHSWTAIGFAVAYVAIAVTTGFVLLGIVPALAASRAWQRREKLAPVAVAAAILTIASAIFILAHHGHY